jgi:hypothetical protein
VQAASLESELQAARASIVELHGDLRDLQASHADQLAGLEAQLQQQLAGAGGAGAEGLEHAEAARAAAETAQTKKLMEVLHEETS